MTEGISSRAVGSRAECSASLVREFEAVLERIEGSFEVREAAALALGNELVRRWIELDLGRVADAFGDEVLVDGQRYRRHDDGTLSYHTLVGAVDVRRASYRQVGVHNGPTVVPLELRAGLVENATPALAFSVTQGFAERPLRHYEVEMQAAHRAVPSRSTLERIGKRIGRAIQAVVTVVEPQIRATEPVVANVHSISIGVDRTTVPMAEVIADASPRERNRPRKRRPPLPVTVAYRMAYVATVSVHDNGGDVLITKRFAATPIEGPNEFMDRIGSELRHLLRCYGPIPVSVVQDGAPELWNLVGEMLAKQGVVATHEVIDRYHVDERLAEICELVGCDAKASDALREAWRMSLNRSDTAIVRIIRRVDELFEGILFDEDNDDPRSPFWKSRARLRLSGDAQRAICGHVEYFRNNKARIRYASSLRDGCPIGSGPTEGACKSVVTTRFKRSGQRWFESGLSPCLSLRALHLSDRQTSSLLREDSSRTFGEPGGRVRSRRRSRPACRGIRSVPALYRIRSGRAYLF
jgi:hypothetical protein